MNETYTSSSAIHYKLFVDLSGINAPSREEACPATRGFRLTSLPIEMWLWIVVAALLTVSASLQIYSIWLRLR